MNNPLIDDGGAFSYDGQKPFELRFTGVHDLVLPAKSTLVVPRAPSGTLADDVGRMRALNHHDWMFCSALYPRAARPGDETTRGYQMVFPSLRTIENRAFGLARGGASAPALAGRVLCIVEHDRTAMDDFHPGVIFQPRGAIYSASYKENITLSARARLLVLRFDADLHLPETMPPVTRGQGFKLVGDVDPVTASLRAALLAGGALSGSVFAFDLAGHQVETYAALLAYEVSAQLTMENAPPDMGRRILVQLVDLHGKPLDRNALPLEAIEFDPPLADAVTPTGTSGACLYSVTFPAGNDARKLKLKAKADLSAIPDAEKHRYRHLQAGYFPGFGFDFKPIGQHAQTEFDLAAGWSGGVELLPPFLRLCVFQPSEEFQTGAGGALNEEGVFALNKNRLVSDDNEVTTFHTGDAYFGDLEKEIATPGEHETVKAIYVTNWQSHAHLYLRGKMSGHGIVANDQSESTVAAVVDDILDPDNHVVVPMDPVVGTGTDRFVMLSRSDAVKQRIKAPFQVRMKTASRVAHLGFVRAGSLVALALDGANGQPSTHQVTASWKNSAGLVPTTSSQWSPAATATPMSLLPMPEGALELGISGDDPPRATLVRKLSYHDILCRLAGHEGGCSPSQRYDDTGKELHVLFLHLQSGRQELIPLRTDPATDAAPDVQLCSFDQFLAIEEMAVAIVDLAASPVERPLDQRLVTRLRTISYSDEAFVNGAVPLSTDEWGGLLRSQIARGVTVKALYWENYLANLATDADLLRGLSNNLELTAILNRTVAGKRGFAMRDRASRPLGSFHQKGIVVVKEVNDPYAPGKKDKVVAYLGGMDLHIERWDTEAHPALDPERMFGTGWHDVHMKVTGTAAVDVLRNFKQRWEALAAFEQVGDPDGRPLNTVPGLEAPIPLPQALQPPAEPGHFVQINRTVPPGSIHSKLATLGFPDKHFVEDAGELGSLHAYLEAIGKARKFILLNDQYFFSVEIARAIHEALRREDGPEFAILLLTRSLNENEYANPLLYKARQRALHALFDGATPVGTPPPPFETSPQWYDIHAPNPATSVRSRVAVLSPVNRAGDDIYVHAKHLLVDDALMSIGSANFSIRGSTYEMEINGLAVGRKLVKGGTDLVRDTRIEMCRRILGLPRAYASLLNDPQSMFRLFKALETQSVAGQPATLNLHPLKPMAKGLDPELVPLVGGTQAGYSEGVQAVMATDENSPGLAFMLRNIIDVDGRKRDDDTTLLTAANFAAGAFYLGEFPHSPVSAYGRVTFDLTAADSAIRTTLSNGGTVSLDVKMQTSAGGPPATPIPLASFPVVIEPVTTNLVIQGLHANQLILLIKTDGVVDLQARLLNGDGAPLGFAGGHVFDPTQTPIVPASFNTASVSLQAA